MMRKARAARRLRAISAAALLSLLDVSGGAAQDVAALRTAPERTGYVETTRYADVVAFMERAAAASPLIHLDTMGYTVAGRPMPLAVVGRGVVADPASVRASGKTVVLVQGNIHAGEVEGKEVALMLLRELAAGRHGAWLDSLVVLVAPIYNADGNEQVSLYNRPLQHGPIGGMGQRANAQGYDLNRDHMKLDAPEAISLVRLWTEYDPHLGLDLHTTNGTRHGYHLTYSPPLHPNTDSSIVRLLRDELLPTAARNIDRATGWDMYYYGDVYGEGEQRGWYTFDHRPRFNTNYIGLRNRFAILSEAFSYATFEERIRATQLFVYEVLDYAHRNAGRLRAITTAADARAVVGQALALQAEPERSAEPVEFLLGEVVEERNPLSGAVMLRRTGVQRPERLYEYGTFQPTLVETAPRAYFVPVALRTVVAKLEQHGVQLRPLARDTTVAAQRFAIDTTFVAEREYQRHRERTIEGRWQDEQVTLPAGQFVVVDLRQPLARLAFYLLEPRSDDGLAAWNALERELEGARTYPILRALR